MELGRGKWEKDCNSNTPYGLTSKLWWGLVRCEGGKALFSADER